MIDLRTLNIIIITNINDIIPVVTASNDSADAPITEMQNNIVNNWLWLLIISKNCSLFTNGVINIFKGIAIFKYKDDKIIPSTHVINDIGRVINGNIKKLSKIANDWKMPSAILPPVKDASTCPKLNILLRLKWRVPHNESNFKKNQFKMKSNYLSGRVTN